MVVETFFGLKRAPFAPESDTRFFVEGEAQRRALSHLRYGLKQGEGIVIITGDEGIGKTTLLDKLQQEYAGKSPRLVRLDAKRGDFENAILAALPEADHVDPDLHFADKLRDLRDEGVVIALLIDNAEALSDEEFEAVRKLSNLFHDGEALLQITLVGESKLRSVLYRSELEKFRQRIIASYHLPPLTEGETRLYVERRMTAAGAKADAIFADGAIAAVAEQSKGVPAQINALATQALSQAAQAESSHGTDPTRYGGRGTSCLSRCGGYGSRF